MNIWWAPGQSDAAADICRGLTRRERAGLVTLNIWLGLCAFGFVLVLMDATMGFGPLHAHLDGIALLVLAGLAAGLWGIIVLQRRVLLNSQAAKDKGYTLSDLKARKPLTRKDYLILIGFGTLAAAVAFAALLAAL